MRWIPLLLIPSIATAAGLTGVWSAEFRDGQTGFNRAVIVDADNQIYFHYESDNGHRCEVFGVAKRRKSDGLYVFKNDSEHNFYANHELYGLEENRDCSVTFEHDGGSVLKVRTTGNCKSFCGVSADIGGDLYKVPAESLQARERAALTAGVLKRSP